MSKVTPNDNNSESVVPSFYLGLQRMSEMLIDEKKEDIRDEQSLSAMSRLVGVSNFFSSPLKQQIQTSKHGKIPNIMFVCMEQVLKRGFKEEGIFRIPGKNTKIQETRKLLEAGKKVYFDLLDITTVASIFKLWLRELPTPLIPFCTYPQLIALARTLKQLSKDEHKDWMDKLKKVVRSIQRPELDCLGALMVFLNTVGRNSVVNLMDPKNLAIVMAPNILYRKTQEEESINVSMILHFSQEMDLAIKIVTLLIEEVEFYFDEKDK